MQHWLHDWVTPCRRRSVGVASTFMVRLSLCLALFSSACATASARPTGEELERREVQAARALFERNIGAINARDKKAYLACYRASPRLVRSGVTGLKRGFRGLADSTPETASGDWPQSLEAQDLELQWISPGVVYGAYRYAVVFDGVRSTGLSERLFIKEAGRWVIAVTTAFTSFDQAP